MRVTRANFGDLVWIRPVAQGMRVAGNVLQGDLLLDRGRIGEFKYTWAADLPRETGPFEIADFGKVYRLSWAAGACAIPLTRDHRFCYWGQRFALTLVDQTMILIDATRPTLVHITAGDLFEHRHYSAPSSHAGRIWIEHSDNVIEIPYAELEALFDRASGPIEVEIEETYPRQHGETRTAEVVEIAHTAMSVKFEDGRVQPIKIIPGVELHMTIELHDELEGGTFHAVTLPGRPRQILHPKPPDHSSIQGELVIEVATDPAGGSIVTEAAPSRQADLDRLFHAIADDPSDVTAREVLVDLLEDSGEPYAAVMHELLAGSTDETKRLEALGPLRYYLEHVAFDDGGLWHSGQLIRDVPLDPAIGDAVAADQRLGLFRALRIGVSSFSVYEKLISSPRAVGLRVVDVPNAPILAALIAGKRTRLTTLMNVKFAARAVIMGLADPTFDRVTAIHTVTAASIVARQLEFFTRDESGFFARAPRELILDDRDDDPDSLHDAVRHAWPKLPVKKITAGRLILER